MFWRDSCAIHCSSYKRCIAATIARIWIPNSGHLRSVDMSVANSARLFRHWLYMYYVWHFRAVDTTPTQQQPWPEHIIRFCRVTGHIWHQKTWAHRQTVVHAAHGFSGTFQPLKWEHCNWFEFLLAWTRAQFVLGSAQAQSIQCIMAQHFVTVSDFLTKNWK